jgi:hypothetical protein
MKKKRRCTPQNKIFVEKTFCYKGRQTFNVMIRNFAQALLLLIWFAKAEAWVGTLPINIGVVDAPVALLLSQSQSLLWVTASKIYETNGTTLSRVYEQSSNTIRAATLGLNVVYYIDDQVRVHRWCSETRVLLTDIEYAFNTIQDVTSDVNGTNVYISDGTSTIYVYDIMHNLLTVFASTPLGGQMTTLNMDTLLSVANVFGVTIYNVTDATVVNTLNLQQSSLPWWVSASYGPEQAFVVQAQLTSAVPTFLFMNVATFAMKSPDLCASIPLYSGVELDGPSETAICQKWFPQYAGIPPLIATSQTSKFIYMYTPGSGEIPGGDGIRIICPFQTEAYATSTWTQCGCGIGQTVDYVQKSCSVCQAGTYVYNNTCVECGSGTFSQIPVGTACTLCSAGTFASNAASVECTACGVRQYSFSGATACGTCTSGNYSPQQQGCYECQSGTYSNIDAQAACTICPSGHYTWSNETGLTACRSCDEGHFANTSTQCVPCTYGTYASSTSNSICTSCPGGYTTANLGSTTAAVCVPCGAGLFELDGQCEICAAGSYTSSSGATVCAFCDIGHYSSGNQTTCALCDVTSIASESGLSTCTSCPSTTYANDVRSQCLECATATFLVVYNTTVAACGPCSSGSFLSADLSQCEPCNGGTFSSDDNSLSCRSCASGTFSLAGASVCQQCAVNTFSVGGASTCIACTVPTFAPQMGSSNCEACGLGSVYDAVNSTCLLCAPNTYYDGTRSTCTDCVSGTRSDAGASACVSCADGSTSVGGNDCTPCAAGSYSTQGDVCSECDAGRYSLDGASNCTACPDSTVSLPNASSCSLCPSGQQGRNGTECVQCPAGFFGVDGACSVCDVATFASTTGQTFCETCAVSSWCPIGSSEELTEQPIFLAPQTIDPLDTLTTAEATFGNTTIIGIVVSACILLLIVLGYFSLSLSLSFSLAFFSRFTICVTFRRLAFCDVAD